eukprot:11127484-Lingulodinium_polyedra.AAC.1
MHACEVKRGRVSMLATLECIVPELTGKFPVSVASVGKHVCRHIRAALEPPPKSPVLASCRPLHDLQRRGDVE